MFKIASVSENGVPREQRVGRRGGNFVATRLIDPGKEVPAGTAETPYAVLIESEPNRSTSIHFHTTDEFQIVVAGSGTLGRHNVGPYAAHYARAYTPYGPLIAAGDTGLSWLTLRARRDEGTQDLPEKRARLDGLRERHPWQVTGEPIFEDGLHPMPGLTDRQGLAGYSLDLKPGARIRTPAATVEGQFVVLLDGGIVRGGVVRSGLSVIYANGSDAPMDLVAGPEGLRALVLNFPYETQASPTTEQTETWHCALCGFAYDEAEGLPAEGIPAGTRWQDLPANWSCPDCSAEKADFERA